MKKFLFKISLILVPLLLLYLNFLSYEKSGGDLNRLGKISVKKDYRNIFENDFKQEKKYLNLSEMDLEKREKIDVITIGDSYSQKGNYGYQNYMALLYGLKTVNIEQNLYNTINRSTVQMLYSIANGDFFDIKKTDYAICESAEKFFVLERQDFDREKAVSTGDLAGVFKNTGPAEEPEKVSPGLEVFEDMTKYFLYALLYNFNDRAFIGQTYKKKLSKEMFSANNSELLFYYDEVENIQYVTRDKVKALNGEMNMLSKKLRAKGVRLIVLSCPDKYDMYYDYILKNSMPKNNFYGYMNALKKDYIFIDSKDILLKYLAGGEKDIYFADDTHWSPLAAKIIAKEIHGEMGK